MARARRLLARPVAAAIVLFARLVTAPRGVWAGCEPDAARRVYFANHSSHGDAVLLWTVLPPRLRERTRAVAAADYWRASPLRRFVGRDVFRSLLIERVDDRNGGGESGYTDEGAVDGIGQEGGAGDGRDGRGGGDAGDGPEGERVGGQAVAAMAAALDEDSLILFPEGTRNVTEATLLPFRSGLFHLAQARPDVDLVPVWIDNLNRVLPKGEIVPIPLVCTVTFGAPLARVPDEPKELFLTRAREALNRLSPDGGGAPDGAASVRAAAGRPDALDADDESRR